MADEHTKSACAASQLAQGRENIACWSCLSILIVSKIWLVSTTWYTVIGAHTVLQDLDLSGGRWCSDSDGDDSGRCDSDRQERAHVEPHFILRVQTTSVTDNSTILSTAASSDRNHNARLPSDDSDYGVVENGLAGVSGQAATNVPAGLG